MIHGKGELLATRYLMEMAPAVLLLLLGLPILLFLVPSCRTTRGTRSAPGPPGLPFIGNLHQLDNSALHRYLWQLSKKYGPIMSLRLGLVQTLVISSARMAKVVYKTHDLAFSSRPTLLGQQKISYNGLDVAFSPYSDSWRELRRIWVHNLFSPKRAGSFRPIRQEEVSRMIDKISKLATSSKLANLSEMLATLTSNIISRIALGKRYDDNGHKTRRYLRIIRESEAASLVFFVSDYFPPLGWLDRCTRSYYRLQKNLKAMDIFYQEQIDEHLNPKRPKSTQEDIIDIFLQLRKGQLSSFNLTMDHIKAMLMVMEQHHHKLSFLSLDTFGTTLYGSRSISLIINSYTTVAFFCLIPTSYMRNVLLGATETSTATIVWAMTELMRSPPFMKKAQNEVRLLIGKGVNVEEDDLENLPYLKAVVKETMRLHPADALSVPRETNQSSIIHGYEIQPKTLAFVNAWAIERDPEAWENPEEFLPERFLGDNTIDFKGRHFELVPFGAGRRGCPGMSMAATTMELVLASLLHSFGWELPAGTENFLLGQSGLVVRPKHDLCLVPNAFAEHVTRKGELLAASYLIDMDPAVLLLLLGLLPILLLFLVPRWRTPGGAGSAPGPPGPPFIGNLHQLDNSALHRYLWQLSKKYGPIMCWKI
ncbi:hypothetical protein RJ639_003967 [Escallonia herrerae]|uniref:Cytochrome P450 n=1 Tax=Escallonia herrerae TaxID=1293975 RepID=A0AA89AXI0_9ASTE|nr:hypothetical protein RJ639_003967 [Escallonia herrerae]